MTSTTTTASVRYRRLVPAALFAAAVALGASTLADPAVASAERVWDVVAYDKCVEYGLALGESQEVAEYGCCVESGGVWSFDAKKCGAPPAERPVPPRVAPGAETSAPFVPGPVTSPTTQTFTPGPAKQGS